MKVYVVVITIPYEDSYIECIFDSRDKARKYLKGMDYVYNGEQYVRPFHAEESTIEEHEVK